MSYGRNGTKPALVRNPVRFTADGFVFLALDYREWGENEGELVVIGNMRRSVDPADQTLNIRPAFDFQEGQPQVDLDRLDYRGSGFSGAHAIWAADDEPRATAGGPVAATDSLDLARTTWKDTDVDVARHVRRQAIWQARPDRAVPPGDRRGAPNLNGCAHLDNVIEYRPVDDNGRISIPLLVSDAEHEELFDRHRADELAVAHAQAHGARAEYSRDLGHHALRHLPRSVRGSRTRWRATGSRGVKD